ncbi:aldehyde dehydrogenase family protein [Novosphingobium sp. Fuku2-ISO-50]|uniref:aldehyde dehydrogenase family protein n=1 Tax=Novosphingobium sp. Fuku2-ISO-50 TaxID=1739114 RepID=UPI00076D8D4E|nr:aldehyde dehydrogenase family protein [Novosphingobium sp. Fuku2-ISO-50]KUR73901.1 aldehyde dehydrogenase [Novosphingobium sp. Fuku2-ISO-50]
MTEAVLHHIVGGTFVGSAQTRINQNPSDLSDIIGQSAEADPSVVQDAIGAARHAFPTWSRTTPQFRSDILDRAGSLILDRRMELGLLLAREEGKILPEAIGEVVRAGQIFKFFAGEALRLHGELLASIRAGVDVEISREPVGVIGLITPWNFPIAIPAWKMAPALAFGNCCILKPAELTPASAYALVAILREAGLPDGVANLVMGRGSDLGPVLLESPDVDAISFTGSVAVGRGIAARCAQVGKRVQCEMGGKNPQVILDDADLDVAVALALNSAFFSTGQRCTAASRLIVSAAIHDTFVDRLGCEMLALHVGNALAPQTRIGPVVDARQLQQDLDYIAIARSEGADVVGGARLSRETEGFFLQPALLLNTTSAMRINQEEIFGPIASVIRVDDDDEAVAVANGVRFGLSAGVCTTSLARARRFKRDLEAGMVMVNLPTAGVDYHVPFGGRKASSIGPREQGTHARDFYTITKTTYLG